LSESHRKNELDGSMSIRNWYIGTMGYSYRDWKGYFYPDHIDARDYLSYYSRYYNAAEIDSTFYGIPRVDIARRWGEITPDGYQMCVKTPKKITHEAGLVGVSYEMNEFLGVMRLLVKKLGVILIQLPPAFTAANFDHLAAFVQNLPEDLRFAVEFRHHSWYTAKTASLLAKYSVCWVATEYAELPKNVEATTDFLYIRFIGKHGRFRPHTHERIDVSMNLEWWLQRIRDLADHVHSVYGFFNNDYAGYAPASANKFKKMLGLPIEMQPLPRQEKLF
jgi:uncharacterized protein YecE (DUF72 family)